MQPFPLFNVFGWQLLVA